MDDRDIERGYAGFHRELNRVLRNKDARAFKAHVAAHPLQAGRMSHCLGLSDEMAEEEMYRTILLRSPLKDLHKEAAAWLRERGLSLPVPRRARRQTRRSPGRSPSQ